MLQKTQNGIIWTNCLGSFQSSCALETGLSNFHQIIITVMKTSYLNVELRVINCRDYKSLSNEGFRKLSHENLKQQLSENSVKNLSNFINTCNTVLDRQHLKKNIYIRGYHSPFMNKTLSKAIMLRTKVRNKFVTNRTDESKTNYVKQRNLCVSLLRKTKKRKISAITRHFKK